MQLPTVIRAGGTPHMGHFHGALRTAAAAKAAAEAAAAAAAVRAAAQATGSPAATLVMPIGSTRWGPGRLAHQSRGHRSGGWREVVSYTDNWMLCCINCIYQLVKKVPSNHR